MATSSLLSGSPQESQDCQLVEKKVRNHGKPPSLGGETGGFYLILGPMELSAAERYTTHCPPGAEDRSATLQGTFTQNMPWPISQPVILVRFLTGGNTPACLLLQNR